MAASPDGSYVYVIGGQGNSLAVFQREEGTGELDFMQLLSNPNNPELGLIRPNSIVVCPDDGSVFVGSDGLAPDRGGVAWFTQNENPAPDRFAVSFDNQAIAALTWHP